MGKTGTRGDGAAPRGRPREFDRERALRCALEVFWRQGYGQTTLAHLGAAMQLNSPSIYCAFGSKADLFLEALVYYRETYWKGPFARFAADPDLYLAVQNLFAEAARILLSPNAPCGCLTVLTAWTISPAEERICAAVARMREETRCMFRDHLTEAINAGQIPPDSDVPALTGALTNFFEGLSLQARGNICQAELLDIAALGVQLLPPRGNGGDL